jgi:hypothetical protein
VFPTFGWLRPEYNQYVQTPYNPFTKGPSAVSKNHCRFVLLVCGECNDSFLVSITWKDTEVKIIHTPLAKKKKRHGGHQKNKTQTCLVGGFNPSEKYYIVSKDNYSQYNMEK